jgi:eukaryotic-like serine/threonine-protein kinase
MVSSNDILTAAHNLTGKTLSTGWHVKHKIVNGENATGGFFSVCYIVEKEGQIGFLKAIDFMAFFKMSHDNDIMKAMSDMTTSYVYERDLLDLCKRKGLDKIPTLLADGIEIVNEMPFKVPYLIFERAQGNVRSHLLDFSDKVDFAWKLKSLHNVAVGLRQLHISEITHQDIKPSNIFVFEDQVSKLGDLGRSIGKSMSITAPHTDSYFAGQSNYAPPEILYGYIISDWYKRVYAIDTFLFGSLVVFYFTGLHMNTIIYQNMDSQFWHINWRSSGKTFEELSPYIIFSFRKAIEEFADNLRGSSIKHEIISLVEKLCYPLPDKRGLSRFQRNPYDLQPVISKLDLLRQKAELSIYSKK